MFCFQPQRLRLLSDSLGAAVMRLECGQWKFEYWVLLVCRRPIAIIGPSVGSVLPKNLGLDSPLGPASMC